MPEPQDKRVPTNHPLYPLSINPTTNEPYLPLPPPHANIIITPPRLRDAQQIPPILNDPRVYMYISGPPLPYHFQDAEEWLERRKKESDNVLEQLRANEGAVWNESGLLDVGGCPVSILRELLPDGTDVFLGDCSFVRCRYFQVKDTKEKEDLIAENEARHVGNPEIIWAMGDYLAPTHHGRGIMTAAIRTLIHQWGIPRMRVRRIQVNALQGNRGSVRVFEKNGFELLDTVPDCLQLPESKGGAPVGMHVLEWEYGATHAGQPMYPMHVNPVTGEPFFRLPPPHRNIIITPSRPGDADAIPPLMNDPRVHKTISGPPIPYARKDAEGWLAFRKGEDNKVIAELLDDGEQRSGGSSKRSLVGGCPASILREVRPDGTEVFLGDLTVTRWGYVDVLDQSRRSELIEQNEGRKPGDPDIIWTFGDYLAPSHHGRGIMTAAVRTLINKWMIPRMGVRKMWVNVFVGNVASTRVFEKNGFVMVGTVENCVEVRGRDEGRIAQTFLKWDLPEES